MSTSRMITVVLGTLLAAYGGWLLVSRQEPEQVAGAVLWLVAGVLLHDAILAPITLLIAAVAVRWLPDALRRPATVALIVLGSLTLLAVPVLGRFGASSDNPTLLDRPYLSSWLVLLALTVVAVAVAALAVPSKAGPTSHEEGADGTDTGRR